MEFMLNATIQQTTGFSPSEIIFGRNICRQWMEKENLDIQNNDANNRRREIVEGIKHKQNIEKNLITQNYRNFEVGDQVLVKKENTRKMDERYEGPYEITGKRHDRSYVLKNKQGKEIIRNVEWIKSFKWRGM